MPVKACIMLGSKAMKRGESKISRGSSLMLRSHHNSLDHDKKSVGWKGSMIQVVSGCD